ncbi:MAG TPA: hypothetical protein VFZ09_20600 [Archangium sp.]|uniref:hypothetical protein n=1 Tax=Archangium sp. TaxID=1872627 RepID=UPI002E2F468B|nr:hypothetical protein [Archangium sp.]HEX5748652.1 hypothetical protein [Archangium sp.]
MSIRLMWCGVLIIGAALGGAACTSTADAGQEAGLQAGEVQGDFCGGIAGIPCAEGYACVDDPRDDCDPDRGGADCGGICRRMNPVACTGHERGMKYVSRDPAQCAAIRFTCKEGFAPFFNECGCGCQKQQKACDYNDPNRSYVSRDPDACAAITFLCIEGFQPFFDECGCGCEAAR